MTTLRVRAGHSELPLVVERDGPVPMAMQIAGQLRAAAATGLVGAGERLPSSRALAGSLGVSRTVVSAAYTQLFAEGWLEGRHGSGTYVAAGAAPTRTPSSMITKDSVPYVTRNFRDHGAGAWGAPGRDGGVIELRPGIPWAAGIDPAAWRRAWRQAGTVAPSAWPEPFGLPALRSALCGYLRRSRGLSCAPGQLLVTRGVASGVSLLAGALVRPGDKVGIEEPGYPSARQVLAASGARVVPCRVDANGIVVDELPDDLRLLYVTPAHQYPLGGRLPVARRRALVSWARASGALIIEDDYDSEFRYDAAPLPSLYAMDPGVVVYLGTTSKTLTPVFGVGWLVASPELVGVLADERVGAGDRTPEAAQHALLALLGGGDLERHIRRMRLEYGRRRAAVVSALGDLPGGARLRGDTAGLHVLLELPGGAADRVTAAAREHAISVWGLDRYYAGPVTRSGLVLGYGAVSLGQVVQACRVLREILERSPA
jgi:GntR family transcriptional regulator/MocR family aminotransferase